MKVDLHIDDVHFYVEGTLTECLVALDSMGFCESRIKNEMEETKNGLLWSQIPQKYEWLAMDKDGFWEVHEQKPIKGEIDWCICNDREITYDDTVVMLHNFTNLKPNFNGDWKDSLMRRPR